jgi:hypothetical protein
MRATAMRERMEELRETSLSCLENVISDFPNAGRGVKEKRGAEA